METAIWKYIAAKSLHGYGSCTGSVATFFKCQGQVRFCADPEQADAFVHVDTVTTQAFYSIEWHKGAAVSIMILVLIETSSLNCGRSHIVWKQPLEIASPVALRHAANLMQGHNCAALCTIRVRRLVLCYCLYVLRFYFMSTISAVDLAFHGNL